MSHLDRKNDIMYISPSGIEFKPTVRQFVEEISISAPSFESPGIDGGIHQYQGLGISKFPLIFEVSGSEHDTKAEDLFNALKEKGLSRIIEPYSNIERVVQVISITRTIKIVKDISRTIFTVLFEEDTQEEAIIVSTNLLDTVNLSLEETDLSISFNFAKQIKIPDISDQIALINIASDFLNEVTDSINAAVNEVEGIIDQVASAPTNFMQSLQTLLKAPRIASERVINKIKGYKDLMINSFNNTLEIFNPENYLLTANQLANNLIFAQAAGGSIMTAVQNELIIADYLTKTELIEAQEEALSIYEYYRDFLDEIQEAGFTKYGASFWSQIGIIQEILQNFIALSNSYLFSIAFSLKLEYIFNIQEPTTIFNIAYEYYFNDFQNDENSIFDFIEKTNKLKGEELLLIPENREIKVYI